MSLPPPPPSMPSSSLTTTKRPLFGGAMEACIPPAFRDVSDIRQVPDHQECWQDLDDGMLLVIEILQRQGSVSDANAASYFFHDLADANGSVENIFHCVKVMTKPHHHQQQRQQPVPHDLIVRGLPQDAVLCFGIGYQKVKLGRDFDIAGNSRSDQQEERTIRVELCSIRLPSVDTDVLITLSSPRKTSTNGDSSIGNNTPQPMDDDDDVDEKNKENNDDDDVLQRRCSETFLQVLSTFQVLDWSLFG